MNTLISFELAKLLKEKGFNKPTLLCYDKCDMLSSYVETVFKPKNYNTSGYVKSAPTIAEVVMWLYEKHGIWISITTLKPIVFVPELRSTTEESYKLLGSDKALSYKNSPTEAYEAAIEYTLKNLI